MWLFLFLTALLLHLTQAIIKDCDYQQINQLLKDAPSGYNSDMSCLEYRQKMAVRNLEPLQVSLISATIIYLMLSDVFWNVEM